MQADGRGVDVHVQKDDVGIAHAVGQAEMRRHRKRGVEQDVVHLSMSLPEFAVQVVLAVVLFRSMQMQEVATKQ